MCLWENPRNLMNYNFNSLIFLYFFRFFLSFEEYKWHTLNCMPFFYVFFTM